ncbi:2Fe-2S ferredoxin-type domain-containing protein [Hyaloraphidium curvatum]|nr:2Fe-2S ferredoxin-type domain-containing protein [Hyaloraphidium curvatum]
MEEVDVRTLRERPALPADSVPTEATGSGPAAYGLVGPETAVKDAEPARRVPKVYRVTLIQDEDIAQTIPISEHHSILDAAQEAGIDLPFDDGCRNGGCLQCACKLVGGSKPGDVKQGGQGFLDEDQIREGYVLACVAYPRNDIKLRTNVASELAADAE